MTVLFSSALLYVNLERKGISNLTTSDYATPGSLTSTQQVAKRYTWNNRQNFIPWDQSKRIPRCKHQHRTQHRTQQPSCKAATKWLLDDKREAHGHRRPRTRWVEHKFKTVILLSPLLMDRLALVENSLPWIHSQGPRTWLLQVPGDYLCAHHPGLTP